jgi:transposase
VRYIEGQSRDQVLVFPEVIDDYVSSDNPIRFIDSFIDMLDMAELGFTHAMPSGTGRKPYNPKDLLKLYVYGYLNKVRSSRMLERETHRNIEVIWLLRKLHPDFKTIADFRKDNARGLKKVFRQFVMLCNGWGLYGNELVAIDGSKFKASNNKRRCITLGQVKKALAEIETAIGSYLRELDEEDESDDVIAGHVHLPQAEIHERITQLTKKQEVFKQYEKELQENGETQISLTDSDSRLMKVNNNGRESCYNVQTAVDSKHKLVSDFDVTNESNDLNQLSNMSNKAKEALEVTELGVVADKGYFKREEIKKCREENVICYVPQPFKSHNKKKGLFTDKDFIYDQEQDYYICPAGNILYPTSYRKERDEKIYTTKECKSCRLKSTCTKNKYGRCMYRWIHEEIIEEMALRVQENPYIIKARACMSEHPFGTIKQSMNQGYFLTRGFARVKGELSITMLAYNIKRVLNVLGTEMMLKAMRMVISQEKFLIQNYTASLHLSCRHIVKIFSLYVNIFFNLNKNHQMRLLCVGM